MKKTLLLISFCGVFAAQARAADPLSGPLADAVQTRSEGVLMEQSLMVGDAEIRADYSSDFRMELRPQVSDDSAGAGLRLYLPRRWGSRGLREQLLLAAQGEQLRIEALEWRELMDLYRVCCEYRMLLEQRRAVDESLRLLGFNLAEADQRVEARQLAVEDRARLLRQSLEWLNLREDIEMERLAVARPLIEVLGSKENLNALVEAARIELPEDLDSEVLTTLAMEHRADILQGQVEGKMLDNEVKLVRAGDGLRLKYIQPSYDANTQGDDDTWGISASFILPWGAENPDVATLRQEQILAESRKDWQEMILRSRIESLVVTAERMRDLQDRQDGVTRPLMEHLQADLDRLDTGRFESMLETLPIHETLLDSRLRQAETRFRLERIAVDLAEEVGMVSP